MLNRIAIHLHQLCFRQNILDFNLHLTDLLPIPTSFKWSLILPPVDIFHMDLIYPFNSSHVIIMEAIAPVPSHNNYIPILNLSNS